MESKNCDSAVHLLFSAMLDFSNQPQPYSTTNESHFHTKKKKAFRTVSRRRLLDTNIEYEVFEAINDARGAIKNLNNPRSTLIFRFSPQLPFSSCR